MQASIQEEKWSGLDALQETQPCPLGWKKGKVTKTESSKVLGLNLPEKVSSCNSTNKKLRVRVKIFHRIIQVGKGLSKMNINSSELVGGVSLRVVIHRIYTYMYFYIEYTNKFII